MVERADFQEIGSRSVALEQGSHGDESRSEQIRRQIEMTRASLDEKLDALGGKVREVQTRARETFDLQHQIGQHPWAFLGTSIAAGYLLGTMTGDDRDDREPRQYYVPQQWQAPEPGRFQGTASALSSGMHSLGSRISSGVSSLSEHAQHLAGSVANDPRRADIFDSLKLAAGAAITDMVREGIRKYIPAIGEQLDHIWHEKGLTPTKAASAIFGSGGQRAPQQGGGVHPGAGDPASRQPDGRQVVQDYDPSVGPTHAGTMRGEVTSRS